jgi:hypothetical protein
MSLIKLNDRAVKDVTQFGSISSLGSLVHISTATASSSPSIEFTSGIDSTYKEYVFYFVNIHPQTDDINFEVNFRDGGSLYDAVKTTTWFRTHHNEADTVTDLSYQSDDDLAQSTNNQPLMVSVGADSDQSVSGYLHLFNPSSTTFVKHFMAVTQASLGANYTRQVHCAGYCNTTVAIDGVKFQMASGNIDAGQILLFGVN